MKELLIAFSALTAVCAFSGASNAAQITIYHYNGTGESVSIANGINCTGGSCSGPYSLAAGREGTLTNRISATNGAFSIWYGYRTSSYPYYECGGAALGKKMSWENTYDIDYYNRGTNCSMYPLSENTTTGNFVYQVKQTRW